MWELYICSHPPQPNAIEVKLVVVTLTWKKCNLTLPNPPPTRRRWPSQRNIPACPSVRPAKKKQSSFLPFSHFT